MLVERLKKIGRAIVGDGQTVTAPASDKKVDAVNENAAPTPQGSEAYARGNSDPGAKKFRLNFHAVSEEDLNAMTSATLQDGGGDYVAPPPRDPEIGEKMPDGTVYAGVSPDSGKAMFAAPEDAPQPMQWKEAMTYAEELDAQGHKDWRLPTKGELNVLFNNRAAIGGFKVTGRLIDGWYWSSSQGGEWIAWEQRFSDGYQDDVYKAGLSSVRCVR